MRRAAFSRPFCGGLPIERCEAFAPARRGLAETSVHYAEQELKKRSGIGMAGARGGGIPRHFLTLLPKDVPWLPGRARP